MVCIIYFNCGCLQLLDFVSVLPSEQLARTAYRCHAYARALRHIEEHVRARPDSLPQQLTFIQVCSG